MIIRVQDYCPYDVPDSRHTAAIDARQHGKFCFHRCFMFIQVRVRHDGIAGGYTVCTIHYNLLVRSGIMRWVINRFFTRDLLRGVVSGFHRI